MTGQDWLEKDFYAGLGVPKDADAAAIKKAYRKLARQYHPDQNAGDAKSEARFKEIGEAYAVLSDPEQRRQYDAVRAMGGGARFAAGPGGAGGAAGFEDLFGGMFGGGGGAGTRTSFPTGGAGTSGGSGGFEDILGGLFGGGRGPAGFRGARAQQGADINATTTLGFRSAVEGATISLDVEGRTVTTRIPAGVRDGQKIRLRAKGRPGTGGGPAGDLNITVKVTPHPVFTIDGTNLRMTLPVTFDEAALGATIDVPTLDGQSVRVKVPAGTPSGRTLRVKGRGVKAAKATGDLLVSVAIVVPQKLDGAARKAVEAFAEATAGEGRNVRADLLARAQE